MLAGSIVVVWRGDAVLLMPSRRVNSVSKGIADTRNKMKEGQGKDFRKVVLG
jgi:hypothetical protein